MGVDVQIDNVDVKIDHTQRTNFVTWKGCVTADDILQAMLALHTDSTFDESYDTLCDYTKAQELVMSPDDMNRLMSTMESHDMRCGRTAMVMPDNRGSQNIAKVMGTALATKGSDLHRMFTSFLEAEVWLGLRNVRP